MLIWATLLSVITFGDCNTEVCYKPVIENGRCTVEGVEVVVICGQGYKLNGPHRMSCQKNRRDYPSLPSCDPISCKIPADATDIKPDFTSDGQAYIYPNKLIKLNCNSNFKTPQHNVRCVTNQTFSALSLPSCLATNCIPPLGKKITNGQITSEYLAPGTKVLIECDEGYKRDRQIPNIFCRSGSNFTSDINKACLAVPCPIPHVPNRKRDDKVSVIQPGEEFLFTCDTHYEREGKRVFCKSGHKFTADMPQCLPKPCPKKSIPNGVLERTSANEVVNVSCDEGYEAKPSHAQLTCISDQIYYPQNASNLCKESSCHPQNITNGELTFNGRTEITHGSEITIKCGDNYQRLGESVVTCDRGEFVPSLPSCQAMPCPIDLNQLDNVRQINSLSVSSLQNIYHISPGTSLRMVCDEPYDLETSEHVRCISGSILNPPLFPACIRVDCDKPTIEHGKVTSHGPLTPDRILTIQCDSGYRPSHTSTVQCFSKSHFRSSLPHCQATPCPLFEVTNGTVHSVSVTMHPASSVTVSCDANYQLEGSSEVTCIAGDTTSPKPSCKPRDCPGFRIKNGAARDTRPGYEIHVQCDAGYDLVGQLPVCLAGDLLTGDLPSCRARPCSTPRVLHSTVTPRHTVTPGSRVTVTCDTQYQISDTAPIVCVTENTFSAPLPSCHPTDCLFPSVQNSTNLHVRIYRPDETVHVECKEGYRKSYENYITCISGKLYDPPELPRCLAQDCTVPMIKHSSVRSHVRLRSGESIQVRCEQGYKVSHDTPITCITDTVFHPATLPSCKSVPCPSPHIEKGKVLNPGTLRPGERLEIICDSDYTMSHFIPVTCVTSNVFHPPNLPTCNDKDCNIPHLTHGKLTPASRPVSRDTELHVVCDPGYDLRGADVVRCVRANTFTPDVASVSCQARPCTVSQVTHGHYTSTVVQPGNVISLVCDPDYRLSDMRTVYCVTEGKYRTRDMEYITDLPTCQAIPCPAPSLPHGTVLGPIQPGHVVQVVCRAGYKVSSETPVRCVSGSVLSAALPTCNAQPCPAPPVLHGSIPDSEIQPGNTVHVTCHANYQLDQPNSVQCVTLNLFTGEMPTCKARPCNLPGVENGIWSARDLAPGGSAQLQCSTGYTARGTQLVRCISGDLFHRDVDVMCIENCVISEKQVTHGYLVSNSALVRPGETVTVRCDEGYLPKGGDPSQPEVVTCVSGLKFNPSRISGCAAVECPVPDHPDHGKWETDRDTLDPGDVLSVMCYHGYISSRAQVTCLTKHLFSDTLPTCNPQPCPVPSIPHGEITNSHTILQPAERLQYSCKPGYYNNKKENVFCVALDKYSADIPTCTAVKCAPPDIPYGTVAGYTSPGDKVNITCNRGLVLLPPDPVYCVTENLFSPATLPKCAVIACPVPVIPHGKITNVGLLEPGTQLNIRCDRDYTLSASRRVVCVSGNVFTTDTLPLCLPSPCQKPVISNGVIKTTGPIRPGDIVKVECGRGYDVTNEGYLQCVSNTTYLFNDTRCHPQSCKAPKIQHGRLSEEVIKPNSAVRLECDLGYKPDCDVAITCLSADNFQPAQLPQCLPQECTTPTIQNGDVTGPVPLIPGNALLIQCRAGYTLSSRSPVSCVTLEQYYPAVLPVCVPVRNCTIPHLTHGSYTSRSLPHSIPPGDTLHYRCSKHLVPIFGVNNVTCLSDVYFDPAPPKCITAEEADSMKRNQTLHYNVTSATTDTGGNKTVVGVLVTIIVILILILIVLLFRNPNYRARILGFLVSKTDYNRLPKKRDIERDSPKLQKPARKPPTNINLSATRPVSSKPSTKLTSSKPPSTILTSSKMPSSKPLYPTVKTEDTPRKLKPPADPPGTKRKTNSGSRHTISSNKLYLSENRSFTSSETPTEISTSPIVKDIAKKVPSHKKPRTINTNPIKTTNLTTKPVAKAPIAFRTVNISNSLPSTDDLENISSESYDKLLDSIGLTKNDFELNLNVRRGYKI